MSEGAVSEAEGGVGTGVLSLFIGLPVALLFNAFVQGQDAVVLLLALAGFGGCIVYGELNVAMPSGVAFGIGMLMTAFLSGSGWPIGLGLVAVIVCLGKYALALPDVAGADKQDPGQNANPT